MPWSDRTAISRHWFGDTEPDWSALQARLAANLPDDYPAPAQPAAPEPLGWIGAISTTLAEAGYRGVRTEERLYQVNYGTGERSVRWSQTTGLRGVWDAIPTAQRFEAEHELTRMADRLRDASGAVAEPVTIRFTTAINP